MHTHAHTRKEVCGSQHSTVKHSQTDIVVCLSCISDKFGFLRSQDPSRHSSLGTSSSLPLLGSRNSYRESPSSMRTAGSYQKLSSLSLQDGASPLRQRRESLLSSQSGSLSPRGSLLRAMKEEQIQEACMGIVEAHERELDRELEFFK